MHMRYKPAKHQRLIEPCIQGIPETAEEDRKTLTDAPKCDARMISSQGEYVQNCESGKQRVSQVRAASWLSGWYRIQQPEYSKSFFACLQTKLETEHYQSETGDRSDVEPMYVSNVSQLEEEFSWNSV